MGKRQSRYIRWFAYLSNEDVPQGGGKNASLGDIATKSDTPLKAEAIAAVSEPSTPRR